MLQNFLWGLLFLGLFLLHVLLLPNSLSQDDFEKPAVVLGEVITIPKTNKLGSQFLINIKTMNGKKHRGKLAISWYRPNKNVHPGEYWQWIVKLKPIHGLHNPGGLNLERWSKMQGVVASGYVKQSSEAILLSYPFFSIDGFREHIQSTIHRHIPDSILGGIINALTIGSRDLLSSETWLVFQRTGTSHLMAISGLHVGLVVAIAYFFMNYFLRCFPWILLRFPAQRLAAGFSVVVAWSYGFLVGFSLPTQRAVIMVTVLMILSIFLRKISVFQRLLLAFLMILALQPLALFSVSFWLSFIAVFWLAYTALGEKKWLRVQIILSLGLLPITLYCFHQFPLISMAANAVAIPWVTFLIVPLCFMASVTFLFSKTLAAWIWWLAAKCFFPLWWLLQWMSHLPFSQWLHPINDFCVLSCALLGVLLLAAPRGLPLKSLGIVLMFPLFFWLPPHPRNNTVWMTVLDVGQGLSVLIQTAHHALVYDVGPRFPTGFDAGRSVVMPFLQTMGIPKVNTLIVSHGDNDHIGGSFWLVAHYPVNTIISSIPNSRWHRDFQACYAGQQWQWDGVKFQMLWPPKNTPYQDNNSSCVLRVSVGTHAILLTGDMEKTVEESLISQQVPLSSEILVAPHHGSRSSSTLSFVQAVHPAVVIMSVGYRNRYHFPAKSVVARYRAVGAQVLSTAQEGAMRFVLGIAGRIGDN